MKWPFQPDIAGMAASNLLIAASILLTKGSFKKFDDFFSTLNLMFVSKAEFYKIQDAYLFPVIDEAWKTHKKELITKLKGKHIDLTGDGRCDSPGYSAKYCTYY